MLHTQQATTKPAQPRKPIGSQSAQPLNIRTVSMIWHAKQWEQAPTLILPTASTSQPSSQAQPTPRKPRAINSTRIATPGTIASNSNQSCRNLQWVSPTVVLRRLSPESRTKFEKLSWAYDSETKILMAIAKHFIQSNDLENMHRNKFQIPRDAGAQRFNWYNPVQSTHS